MNRFKHPSAAACAVVFILFALIAASARVYQKRGLSWNSLFDSMPGARSVYTCDIRINGLSGRAEVWTMNVGLNAVWGRFAALLAGKKQTLPGLGSAKAVVLGATGAANGLVLFESGMDNQSVGIMFRHAHAKSPRSSPEAEALVRALPGAELVFDAESGTTRLESFETMSNPTEAMDKAVAGLAALGWKPMPGNPDADTRFLLKGRGVCVIRSSNAVNFGGSRLSLACRVTDEQFKE